MNWQTTLTTVGIALLFILSGSTRQNQTQAKDVSEIASNPLAIRFERFSQRPTFQSAQTSQVPQAKTALPKQMSGEDQLAKANTQFGFKLFSTIISQDKNKNVFVSPISVAIALDMLYNGASGTTQQEMAQALALHGISPKELNTANQALQKGLQKTDEQVQKRDRSKINFFNN